jgi:hypothetical protein
MLRTLVGTDCLPMPGDEKRSIMVRYFEARTMRGARRYSAEMILQVNDKIILDDDSLENLKTRAARILLPTEHSRALRDNRTI